MYIENNIYSRPPRVGDVEFAKAIADHQCELKLPDGLAGLTMPTSDITTVDEITCAVHTFHICYPKLSNTRCAPPKQKALKKVTVGDTIPYIGQSLM